MGVGRQTLHHSSLPTAVAAFDRFRVIVSESWWVTTTSRERGENGLAEFFSGPRGELTDELSVSEHT